MRSCAITGAAFVIAFAVLTVRYPAALFVAEPIWEDGTIFYLGGFQGPASLAIP